MRLRVHDDTYSGTPLQIVERMRERDHSMPKTADEYMQRVMERSPTFRRFNIYGVTVEARCARFLTGLVRNLDAEIV